MQASILWAGPKPGNREGCGRKGIRLKLLRDTGIILALICVAAASQLVVTQGKVGARSPSNQPGTSLNPEWIVQRRV